jgi:hypothetical protein
MHRPNDRQQFIPGRAFQDIARRAGAKRALDLCVGFRCGQDNDAGLWKLASYRHDGIGSVRPWRAEIHESDIGAMDTELIQGIGGINGLCNELHVVLRADDSV